MSDRSLWRPVPGFQGYEINADGQVRNAKTRRVLRTQWDTIGRAWVGLHRDGKMHTRRVHRLLAQAFLPPPLPGQTDVCHNNGDRSDNRLSNLRWDTHAANQLDIREHGTARNQNTGITHCRRGHEFTEENTYTFSGGRACRACRRISHAEYRKRKKAAT